MRVIEIGATSGPKQGQKDIIELLRQLIEEVEAGDIRGMMVVAISEGDNMVAALAGYTSDTDRLAMSGYLQASVMSGMSIAFKSQR